MAENLSALELVPRGVEGTGKAVVLGNEPVVQSLARLSGRMDNLAKLKLYAQAKKAEAKQPKVEYDKTPFDIPGLASGVATSIVSEIVNPEFEAGVKIYPSLNPEQKVQYKSTVGRLSETGNNFILKTEADLPKRAEELKLQGWEVSPQDFSQGARLFFNENISAAQQEAEKAGITDENAIRKSAGLKTILNPMGLVDAFSRTVTSNPNKINLNNFGARIIKNIDETGVDVEQADGTFLNINRNNVRNNDKSLNYDLIKRAISANPMDEKMLNLASSQYLESAAKRTGNVAAANAVDKYLKGEKISDDELKLIQEEALPSAQNAVIEKMFAGKGKFEVKKSYQTTEDKIRAEAAAYEKQGIKTYTGDAVYTNTIGTVLPEKYGFVPQTQNGIQNKVGIKNLNLGNSTTKTLSGNDKFKINTGSRVWFFGYAPQKLQNLLASKFADGSASLNIPIETSNLTVLDNIPYATVGNPEFIAENGQKFILPKGAIVNAKTYNSKPIAQGGQFAVIDIEDAIKFLPEETRKKVEIQLKKEPMQGFRMIVGLRDNAQAMAKFRGEVKPVSVKKSSGSVNFLR